MHQAAWGNSAGVQYPWRLAGAPFAIPSRCPAGVGDQFVHDRVSYTED
jgi:hypothetical protein